MPLVTDAPERARRHALVIGTARYAPGWPDIADGVLAEMATAKRLLLEVLGYRRDTFKEILDPDESQLKKEVAKWRGDIDLAWDDWLLVYYTGHGVDRAGTLNLITRDVDAAVPETAPTAQALVSALLGGQQMPRHALLVLDTCHAAAAHFDTAALATRLREAEGGAVRGADFHVIATARSISEAFVGHFMDGLHTVMTTGQAAGSGEEYVQPSAAIEQVNRFLSTHGGQRASYSGGGESALRFLPNPAWLPSWRPNMEGEERRRVLHRIQSNALLAHWGPRARGVSTERDAGWFFTGRSRALRHMIEWLTDEAGGGGLVVKGLPGSGKSAVLARLATLADPHERAVAAEAGALKGTPEEELPPLGVIDVAVHARAKDAAKIALEIATTLELELAGSVANPEVATVTALAARPGRTVIVVDALDEAVRPADCATFLRELLKKTPRLRLIVGVRESGEEVGWLTALLGSRFTPLDLDAAQWREPQDMIHYAERYLRSAPSSPYVDATPVSLHNLAESIANRAGNSFLVASATAHALVARGVKVDTAALEPLPETVGDAFDLDLKRFEGIAAEQLRRILTALACGEGRGVPAEEWLVIAQALSEGDVTEADIKRWSEEAAFYIVADEEFGMPVRRLYHEEFTAHLRRHVDTDREAAIAAALVPIPRMGNSPVWRAASSYVLAFYAKHLWRARNSRELSKLTSSPRWVQAKRDRFGDLALILSDLDLALDLARRAEPPDLNTILHACAIYGRFATTAPPVVIDVLAGLGQRARAEIMAESIDFPLDRCQAFALLAPRYASAGDHARAISCVRAAEHAAHAIRGHYHTLAFYWVVCAARAAGQPDAAQRVSESIHRSLQGLMDAMVTDPASNVRPTGIFDAVSSQIWSDRGGEADVTFALPHWLFWAAMCLRELDDVDGLAQIRAVLAASRPKGNNLPLQTAAVVGDVTYLRAVQPGGIVKPGNLALALMEADLVAEFDALRTAGAFAEPGPADSTKRYAWALARRGDFEGALKVAATVGSNPEEQARALFRIAQTALAAGEDAALQHVAADASKLHASSPEVTVPDERTRPPRKAVSKPRRHTKKSARASPLYRANEPWRVESWLAAVMLAADRTGDAAALAESVCAAGVIPSPGTSLVMATPQTAVAKGHVRLDSASGPDAGLQERVLQIATASGTTVAREHLEMQGASARSRATILAQLARSEPDPGRAYSMWLDALT